MNFLFVHGWYWITFGTCFVVLLFLSVGWFCVEVRWLAVEMIRQLHRVWLQWPRCWLSPMNRRRLVVGMREKLRSGGSIVSWETIRQRSREGLTRRKRRHGHGEDPPCYSD